MRSMMNLKHRAAIGLTGQVAGIQVVRRIRDASLLELVLDEALSAQPVVRRYLFDTLVSVRQILVPVLAERIENAETIDELRALITLGGELAAVELFDDPEWKKVAQYRSGDFEAAARHEERLRPLVVLPARGPQDSHGTGPAPAACRERADPRVPD